ncbi:MAG: hypothetical protein IPK08_11755 [Bacteroidetes bacterium]|nr:hypothetical protein [Bacteroidota bacterium]
MLDYSTSITMYVPEEKDMLINKYITHKTKYYFKLNSLNTDSFQLAFAYKTTSSGKLISSCSSSFRTALNTSE